MKRLAAFALAILLSALGYAVVDQRISPSIDATANETRSLPSDYHWLQRTFPYFEADAGAYRAALSQRTNLRRSRKTTGLGTWEPAGPTNIGGRVSDIEFDPVNPNTIYAAAATGGIFKSSDLGESWAPIFDEQAVLTVGDIAVDPQEPQTIYVGTGEANGGHNNFAGGGVYKSTNAGATWSFKGLEETVSIGRVVVHPGNSNRVYVAAVGSYFAPDNNRGLFRTDDGGDSWERVLFVNDSTGVIDVLVHPELPSLLLAATWERVRRPSGPVYLHGAGSGVFRSEDGGDSWQRLGAVDGLPNPDSLRDETGRPKIGRIGLSLSRNNPDVVHALFTDGFQNFGLYKSTDFGKTWVDADPNERLPRGEFSWYFGQVRTHPDSTDHVFVLDIQIGKTFDGGASWTTQAGTHVDHHAMAFHPTNPDFIVEGNDGGIAISEDGGAFWRRVSDLPITQFYEIAFDPSNPDLFYGGTQDNGTIQSPGGEIDDWQRIYVGDGFYVIIDPLNSNIVYAESQFGGLAKSTDGGLQFFSALQGVVTTEPRNWSMPVVMDPSDNNVLYLGTNRLYRTTNQAASWLPVSPNLTDHEPGDRLGTITTIAVAPSDANVIYAGTDDGNVWVTTDYGLSWTDITAGLPLRWVTRLAVDHEDPGTVYVTFSGLKWRDPIPHVFRSNTYGAQWDDISSDLPDAPINALAIDPTVPGRLFVGTDVGAFVTEDDGTSWDVLGDGMPAVPISDMKYIAELSSLLAGTHGRSMYVLDLSVASSVDQESPETRAITGLSLYPNPSEGVVALAFILAAPSAPVAEVFDVTGRLVHRSALGTLPSGAHEVELSTPQLPAGSYIVRIRLQDHRQDNRQVGTSVVLTRR